MGRATARRAGARRDGDGGGLPRRATCGRCTWSARTRCSRSPTSTTPRRRSRQLDFLVVQDLFMHETAGARPRVPARGAPSPRRTGRSPTPSGACSACAGHRSAGPGAAPTGGSPRELAKRVARRLGRRRDGPVRLSAPRPEIFDEMARAHARSSAACPTRGSIARRAAVAAARRRITPARAFSTARAFRSARRASCRSPQTRRRPPELPDADYPFLLNTGRLLYHWHGGTLTRRVQGLLELAPRLEVAIHPSDARRLGVDDGGRPAGRLTAGASSPATRA